MPKGGEAPASPPLVYLLVEHTIPVGTGLCFALRWDGGEMVGAG